MKRRYKFISLLLMCTIFISSVLNCIPAYATEESEDSTSSILSDLSINTYPYYRDVEQEYLKNKYVEYQGEDIVFMAKDIASSDYEYDTQYELNGTVYEGVLWNEAQKQIDFEIIVPETALYEIAVEYGQPVGNSSEITRKLYVDGEPLFQEAFSVAFSRFWKYDAPLVDTQGDEIKPFANEKPRIATAKLTDSQGKEQSGFQFYLTEGKHTITFEYIAEPIFISKIILTKPENFISYEELQRQYKEDGKTAKGSSISFDAESSEYLLETTDSVIGPESSGDPATYPESTKNIKMNYIGGWNYKDGNQSITWRFNVEESGLYQFGFRVYRIWQDGLPTFRQIAIDGKVPCTELECYEFPYAKNWYTEVLSDGEEPFSFWLEEGEHTISFTVKLGIYGETIDNLTTWTKDYATLIRRIKMFTGEDPDPNYDYELVKNMPGLIEELQELRDMLDAETKILVEAAGDETPVSNGIESIVIQTEELIKRPDKISKRLSDMETALSSIGNYITSLKDNPMGFDKVYVYETDEEVPDLKSTWFSRLIASIEKFFISFTKDYNSVSSVEGTETSERTIKIWIGRGKEWAEIIKQLSDAYFTPESGISVETSIIPASQVTSTGLNSLTLAMSAGTEPDVILGMGSTLPVEYAMRGSIVDLTEFEDFDEVQKRFYSEGFVPLQYEDGIYGLPETVNFRAVFYRTDIFEELGLTVPETWDELYNTTLPALYRNNMECYIPMLYDVFLFQNGGAYYTEDLYHTGLDSVEAFQSFKELCELYINYDIPVSVNFFNRFRTGETPIGIGDFSTYSTLVSAASELDGSWALAPICGTEQEDGTINRASAGFAIDSSVIVSSCEDKEAAWEFLKWWTSDEIQTKFCSLIESNMGVTARYNTANINANGTLGYTAEEKAVIDNFYANVQESEVVIGGYYTSRYVTNAWNNVVVNGYPVRDSFEEAVEEIEKELKRRQEEFGIFVD